MVEWNGWGKETFSSSDSKGHLSDLNICQADSLRPLSPAWNRYVQVKHSRLHLSVEKEVKPELAAGKGEKNRTERQDREAFSTQWDT